MRPARSAWPRRAGSARAAAARLDAVRPPRLVVELAGGAPAVDDAAWLIAADARAVGRSTACAASGRRAGPGRAALPALLRRRGRPPRQPRSRAGAGVLRYPGLGAAFAFFAGAGGEVAARAFDAVAAAAREAGGSFVLEAAPASARAAWDAFGAAAALLPLTRALKQRFDPAGVLNPGRQLGRT
jgi:hypothetical protein